MESDLRDEFFTLENPIGLEVPFWDKKVGQGQIKENSFKILKVGSHRINHSNDKDSLSRNKMHQNFLEDLGRKKLKLQTLTF